MVKIRIHVMIIRRHYKIIRLSKKDQIMQQYQFYLKTFPKAWKMQLEVQNTTSNELL